ncbi:MAG: metallophosphoesterase [Solirubrobacteraceae bacterium]
MRTLVISDLHLGSRGGRDVLRRPAVLDRLLERLADVDRLVLLGDVVELLEGRTAGAMTVALPLLERIGAAVGDAEIVVVPGNHDHALVRGWVRSRRDAGLPLGDSGAVPHDATVLLLELTQALASGPSRPRIRVHYPGVWLTDGVYAHHGHYADVNMAVGPVAAISRAARQASTGAEAYEASLSASVAAAARVVGDLPPGFEDGVQRVTGLARALGKAVFSSGDGSAARFGGDLVPLVGHEFLERRLGRGGLVAMQRVAEDLGVASRARHVLFGHVHRLGPLDGAEALERWRPDPDGPWLWNSGCWVHEPLIVGATDTTSPYWPGGALLVEDGRTPEVLRLLEDLEPAAVVPEPRALGGGSAER